MYCLLINRRSVAVSLFVGQLAIGRPVGQLVSGSVSWQSVGQSVGDRSVNQLTIGRSVGQLVISRLVCLSVSRPDNEIYCITNQYCRISFIFSHLMLNNSTNPVQQVTPHF